MLSKEGIEEAKEFLWDIDDYLTEHSTDENGNVIDEETDKEATKINNANYYIMQLEQENRTLKHTNKSYKGIVNKQNKVINEMAEQLSGLAIWNNEKEEPLILGDKEDVKQYFEKKVEEK